MNTLALIVLIVLFLFGIGGLRKGLVESVIDIVSSIFGMVVLVVLVKGIGSFMQGSYANVLLAVLLLAVIQIVSKLIRLILDSVKLVSKLPIVSWVDKLAGAVLGVVQGIFFFWMVCILFGLFDFEQTNAWIMQQVADNALLTLLYRSNLLVYILMQYIPVLG